MENQWKIETETGSRGGVRSKGKVRTGKRAARSKKGEEGVAIGGRRTAEKGERRKGKSNKRGDPTKVE